MKTNNDGEYLLGNHFIMESNDYDEYISQAVYVNKHCKLRYVYWETIYYPKQLMVEL